MTGKTVVEVFRVCGPTPGGAPIEKKVMTHRTSQNPPPPSQFTGTGMLFPFFLPVPGIYLFLTGCGVRLWVNVCLCGCLIFPSGEWVIVDVAIWKFVSCAGEGRLVRPISLFWTQNQSIGCSLAGLTNCQNLIYHLFKKGLCYYTGSYNHLIRSFWLVGSCPVALHYFWLKTGII